jgi:DNA-binding transcriptional ArsR family regulator
MKFPPAAAKLLACLGDPSRFSIVRTLASGRRCVTELAIDVGLSQSCTTRHLQALERAGIVRGQREGRRVTFGLSDDPGHVVDLVSWALRHETMVAGLAAEVPGSKSPRPRSGPGARRPRPPRRPDPGEAKPARADMVSKDIPGGSDPEVAEEPPRRFNDLEDYLL